MPFDFTGGPAASLDIGGGAHGQVFHIEALDNSCIWNGFPVYMFACPPQTCVLPTSAYVSVLKTNPLTLAPLATSTAADWPPIYVGDAGANLSCGFEPTVRLRGTYVTAGVNGNARVGNDAAGLCVGDTELAGGPFTIDTGYQACGLVCANMISLGRDYLTITPELFNASNAIGWTFKDWRIDVAWASNGAGGPSYCANQDFGIIWNPPCSGDDGLFIHLPTDGCGNLTLTYTALQTLMNSWANANGISLVFSTLGGHGGDIATPDGTCIGGPFPYGGCGCTAPPYNIYYCAMGGADCSAAVDN